MSHCLRCGQTFQCAMADKDAPSPCWCTRLPLLPADRLGREGVGCYCPDCLAQLVAGAQADAGER